MGCAYVWGHVASFLCRQHCGHCSGSSTTYGKHQIVVMPIVWIVETLLNEVYRLEKVIP